MLLPPEWIELTAAEARPLESELQRELAPEHQLYGRELRAVARRDSDDVLFAAPDREGPVFWVHLTWRVEQLPDWPWVQTYRDHDDFVERWPREELGESDAVTE